MDVVVSLTHDLMNQPKEVQVAAVDKEIERFSVWMTKLSHPENEPLNKSERALLRTYLMQKLHGRIDSEV